MYVCIYICQSLYNSEYIKNIKMLLWQKLKEQSAQPTHQIRSTIVTMYNRKSKSSEISLKPTFTGITDITFQNTSRISRCYSGIN